MKVYSNIHSQVKRAIEKIKTDHGLTTAEFSEKIGVPENTIHQWLYNSTRLPNTEGVLKISNAFGFSTDYILGQIDFTQIGNKEISAITGLNDKAINTLRLMKQIAENEKSAKETGQIKSVNQDYTETLNFILSDPAQFMRFMEYLQMYINNYSLTDFDKHPCILQNDKTGLQICETPSALLENHAQNQITKILFEWQQKKNDQRQRSKKKKHSPEV